MCISLMYKAIAKCTPPDHGDYAAAHEAQAVFASLALGCNNTLKVIQSRLELEKIYSQLDFSRIEHVSTSTPLASSCLQPMPVVVEHRTLVKRGPALLITFSGEKVVKSKEVWKGSGCY
jgi:hypothetical protein